MNITSAVRLSLISFAPTFRLYLAAAGEHHGVCQLGAVIEHKHSNNRGLLCWFSLVRYYR
ncbi:MAG: hypothetical protein ACL7BU_13085 [Candidatus Phlomobacter fragariae]